MIDFLLAVDFRGGCLRELGEVVLCGFWGWSYGGFLWWVFWVCVLPGYFASVWLKYRFLGLCGLGVVGGASGFLLVACGLWVLWWVLLVGGLGFSGVWWYCWCFLCGL